MDEWIMTQENFDRLWSRVQGTAPAPPSAAPSALQTFLDETGQTLALEHRLLCRSGRDRAELLALCRASKSRLRRLRIAYFLQTGENRMPPDACPVSAGYLQDLRRDWLCAARRSAAYAAEVKTTSDEALRGLYSELAGEEAHHAEMLRCLIARKIG
jgi:hypothetical protein